MTIRIQSLLKTRVKLIHNSNLPKMLLNNLNNNIFYSWFFFFVITIFVVTFLLLLIAYHLSNKQYYAEKVSAYECGFEPFHGVRRPINTNFYNIALLFLLFDVELIILFPGISCLTHLNEIGKLFLYIFIFLLWFGYAYELNSKSLYIIR